MTVGEWDQRVLCPNGGCVGLIGADGTCKVCGHVAPNWGDERNRGLVVTPDPDEDGDETDADTAGPADPISPSAPAALGEAADWQARTLCPDGACTGLIGADGRCRQCGRAGAKAAAGDRELLAAAGDLAGVAAEDELEALRPAPSTEDDDEDDDELDDELDDDDDDLDDEDDDDDEDDEDDDEDEDDDNDRPDAGDAAALDQRVLCPDGACVGVIGDDGRCKVCGTEAA